MFYNNSSRQCRERINRKAARLSVPDPPPPLRRIVLDGLRGALLLARGRAEGLALIEASPAGALRSLWALAVLPLLMTGAVLLSPRGLWGAPGETIVAAATGILREIVSWLGAGLAVRPVARVLGREEQWPQFLAALNWVLALTTAAMGLLGAVSFAGLASIGGAASARLGLAVGLTLLLGCYGLWLIWFVARAALGVRAAPAAAVVVAAVGTSLILPRLIEALAAG